MYTYASILEHQRKFFLSGKTRTLEFRTEALKSLKKEIASSYDILTKALAQDFGKPEFETFATEITAIEGEISVALKNLASWMKSRQVSCPPALFKSSSGYFYEPFGCVLIISAWNYPFNLSFIPLVNAIAAGNCCILKPSETAPCSSSVICKIVKNCFDEDFCTAIEGGPEETSALLSENFDLIHFTGSSRVGKIVALAAAEHLTPAILELGGKSPCIVDETADLEVAARRICWGKFANAGQTCVAPDYLMVQENVRKDLLFEIKKTIRAFYGENPEESPDYARIINEKHFDRLIRLTENQKILYGGRSKRDSLYIEPTILLPENPESPIMQEEIFGPLLPVFPFGELSEVIPFIAGGRKRTPLSLYIFSRSKKNQKTIIKNIPFGGGCINTTVLHVGNPGLPFGGVGMSGMGYYHGYGGFRTFSHLKSILSQANRPDFSFRYPPYRNRVGLLKKIMHFSSSLNRK